MASDRVYTMNLSDDGEGMVPISQNQSTSFIKNEAQIQPEKNVSQSKETMDSTPINDIMMEPAMMAEDPRMPPQMPMSQPQMAPSPTPKKAEVPESKNPLNLTDDQLVSLIVAVATGIAVSKPIQDRLATSIPKFLNEQGGRSMIGLASTGAIAAIIFFIAKTYIIKV